MQKILLVDRYKSFIEAVIRRLENEFRVGVAHTLNEALKELVANPEIGLVVIAPDIITWPATKVLVKEIKERNSEIRVIVLANILRSPTGMEQVDRFVPRFRTTQTIKEVMGEGRKKSPKTALGLCLPHFWINSH